MFSEKLIFSMVISEISDTISIIIKRTIMHIKLYIVRNTGGIHRG